MTQPWPLPSESGHDEPIKRLSINLPQSLHTRFKTVCSATNRRMVRELLDFIESRTAELEEETGLWRDQANPVARRTAALERALTCNHPTGEIEEMLADIERGRDLR